MTVTLDFYQGKGDWANAYGHDLLIQEESNSKATYNLYGNTIGRNLEAGGYALLDGAFLRSVGDNNLPAQRFYFTRTETAGSPQQAPERILMKEGGVTTGVAFVGNDNIFPIDSCYYDLQGRRVDNPQSGQIYIHQGRKIVK